VRNALFEMREEPKILTIELCRSNRWGIIQISDNGRGIPEEDLEKIFVPFYTTKNTKESWGVGLSHCCRIVSAHRGKILVESEVGKGTTFKIMLPCNYSERSKREGTVK
jgi:signal transduction histidine kinase